MTFEETHKPMTLDSLVFPNDGGETIIRNWAAGDFDHLLFHGAHGSGKSTIANLLPQIAVPNIHNGDVMFIDSKDDTPKRKLVTRITEFASEMPFSRIEGGDGIKFVIIDEFEGLKKHQERLRVSMDKYRQTSIWLLCTNNLGAIDSGIVDRCEKVSFEVVDAERMKQRASTIAKAAGKKVTDRKLDTLVLRSGSSMRTLLREIKKLP